MQINEHIATRLCSALDWPANRIGEVAALLAEPPDPALGDVAFPCFGLARERRQAPAAIAQALAARLTPDHVIARSAPSGPYLNLFLDRGQLLPAVLRAALADPAGFGRGTAGAGRTAVVDFSSPNIAKPFHFGHLRSTNLGAGIARLLEFQGYRVIRRNYLGDWGTQFGFVIHAWQHWGDEAELAARAIDYLVELYIRAYRASEQDPGVRDAARSLFLKLEQGDPEVRALWSRFRELSLAGFQRTYARLGIAFDSYAGESSVNDAVTAVIDRFVAAGVAVESEGALVVHVAELIGREIAPCMLRKSDGASTYAARDCAEALARQAAYGFDANLYVVSRQEDHFAQVFAALTRLGQAEGWADAWPARCENVSFGFVKGMSTRKGEAVWLDAVLNEARDQARRQRQEKSAANARAFPELSGPELDAVSEAVGLAAVLYFDVSARRMTDVTFDWQTVLQFEGNTGPYLQYSHARMCGIFRKAAADGLEPGTDDASLAALGNDEEWALARKLLAFGATVARAAREREPFEVARYLNELSAAFNAFYNTHQVIEPAARARSSGRLALVAASRNVLATGLGLLGIAPLETM